MLAFSGKLFASRLAPTRGCGCLRVRGDPEFFREQARSHRGFKCHVSQEEFGLTANAPWRSFAADTLALILFFTATGILNERFVAGMNWEQVLHARLLGAALMVVSGRPYGLWRDWIMRFAGTTRFSQIAWDSLALVSFQVPIYAAILAISGATAEELLRGACGVTVIMLALGRPYGAFLNFVRRRFGLPAGGEKPMSLSA